jgi:hypothetical protein
MAVQIMTAPSAPSTTIAATAIASGPGAPPNGAIIHDSPWPARPRLTKPNR